jgi:hypothetical protein
MKKIIALIFLLATMTLYAQVAPQYKYLAGGEVIGFKFTDLDSTETAYSDWFDATAFDNSKQVYAWIKFDGYDITDSTADSLSLVLLEGRYPPLNGEGTTSNITAITIDTLGTNNDNGYQNVLGTSYTLYQYLDTVTVGTATTDQVPPVRALPEWRIKITVANLTVSTFDGTCWIYLYSKNNDPGITPEMIRGY